jgi:hypothetical protein
VWRVTNERSIGEARCLQRAERSVNPRCLQRRTEVTSSSPPEEMREAGEPGVQFIRPQYRVVDTLVCRMRIGCGSRVAQGSRLVSCRRYWSNGKRESGCSDVVWAADEGDSSKGACAAGTRTNGPGGPSGRSGRCFTGETQRTPSGTRMQQAWNLDAGENCRGGERPRGWNAMLRPAVVAARSNAAIRRRDVGVDSDEGSRRRGTRVNEAQERRAVSSRSRSTRQTFGSRSGASKVRRRCRRLSAAGSLEHATVARSGIP